MLSIARTEGKMLPEDFSMTVPVYVEQTDGQFCASLVGSPEMRCIRPSRAEAIAALQNELAQKIADGNLVNLEIQPLGVSGLAGRFQDDPELRDICDQIYRDRDADQPQ
jgi:hypothetical protein